MLTILLPRFSKIRNPIVLALLVAAIPLSAAPGDALKFFNNYFVPGGAPGGDAGGYKVAGVGLRGLGGPDSYARGTINMPSLPPSAHVIAAYLYWQSIQDRTIPGATSAASRGTFRGMNISGKLIGSAPSCWSSGGGSGTTSGAEEVRSYRADVLRHLPIGEYAEAGGKFRTKVRMASGSHAVALFDSGAGGTQSVGTGNQFARAQGASLVVIYRDLSQDPNLRYKAISIYDGAHTFDQTNPSMTQTVEGFYQPLNAPDRKSRMTHIVGDGDKNFQERLFFNSTALTSPLVSDSTNPFQGAEGQAWDNLSVDVSSLLSSSASSFTTSVAPVLSSVDCMSWSAIIFETDVQDSDKDGLLDGWESAGGYTDLLTSKHVPLPGSDPQKPDVFLEIDYMVATGVDSSLQHSHRPKNSALAMLNRAYTDAGMNLHIDIGKYSNGGDAVPAYIVPESLAKGGDKINERLLMACNTTNTCPAILPDSGIGWRRGLQLIKAAKTVKGTDSPRYSELSRRFAYHYALFGHALLRGRTHENDNTNPGLLTKISGIGDKPGSNILVTLGMWRFDDPANCVKDPLQPLLAGQQYCNDRTGNSLTQAGTLGHELGHNAYLSHGGDETVNCKSNHVSVMNYLFQVRGVPKGDGSLIIDYSRGNLQNLNEAGLQEQGAQSLGTENLRTRWYAPPSPLDQKVNATLGNRPAKRRCDGSTITSTEQMVRVDGSTPVSQWIDWNNNQINNGASLIAQDINFSGGALSSALADSNDWARVKLNLRQIGGSQTWTKVSSGIKGTKDLGLEDVGLEDVGLEDVGLEDVGLEDVGLEDVGLEDVGLEDVGLEDVGEVDYDIAASTVDAPTGLNAVIGKDFIELTWKAPEFGIVYQYAVWRDPGKGTKAGLELIGTVNGVNGATPVGYFKDTSVRKNVTYNYYVTAFACDTATNSCAASDLIQSPLSAVLTIKMQ